MHERVRRMRRNKLMTSVISVLRMVPINSPGGGNATLGDESRPPYSVVVTEDTAREARRKFQEASELKKLH
jgi:hypothetical protein